MRRQWEDEGGAALSASDGAAEGLRLEAAQLLHEIGGLHEGDVGKVQVAKDLVLEAARPLLAWPRQVDPARVAPQALFVVDVVVVDARRLCIVVVVASSNSSSSRSGRGGTASTTGIPPANGKDTEEEEEKARQQELGPDSEFNTRRVVTATHGTFIHRQRGQPSTCKDRVTTTDVDR